MRITFISGKRNSGKTTWAKNRFTGKPETGGILLVKVFSPEDENLFLGYNAVNLDSGEEVPFARLKENPPDKWRERERFGPFSFSHRGFKKAEEWIERGAKTKTLVIDEIGPMELEGMGFAEVLRRILDPEGIPSNPELQLYLVIRSHRIEHVEEAFQITPDEIIMVDSSPANQV